MKMLLSQLLAGQTLAFDASITHLALDSRKVSAGGLFLLSKAHSLMVIIILLRRCAKVRQRLLLKTLLI